MNETTYRLVIIGCGVVALCFRYGFAWAHRTQFVQSKPKQSDYRKWLLYNGPAAIIGVIIAAQICGAEWLRLDMNQTADTIIRTTGILLGLVASFGIVCPQFVRGKTWCSPMTSPDQIVGHKLVVDGPYKYIRHPFYAACILGVLAVELTLASALAFILPPLLFAIVALGVRHEERQLAVVYGEDYKTYQAQSWRLIPGVF